MPQGNRATFGRVNHEDPDPLLPINPLRRDLTLEVVSFRYTDSRGNTTHADGLTPDQVRRRGYQRECVSAVQATPTRYYLVRHRLPVEVADPRPGDQLVLRLTFRDVDLRDGMVLMSYPTTPDRVARKRSEFNRVADREGGYRGRRDDVYRYGYDGG